jgi:hypothetical protein
MSELLNYIKTQKNKGMDDYMILQSTKRFSHRNAYGGANTKKDKTQKHMVGGYQLTKEEKEQVRLSLDTIDANADGYSELSLATMDSGDGTLEEYENFDAVLAKLDNMRKESSATQQQESKDEQNQALGIETDNLIENQEIVPINIPEEDKTTVQVDAYSTLKPGDILFYPTQDIKQFDDTMMFADITQVLDQSKKRSFTMFFTPNEEYARRYSGIWSLNKRPVYVHKLVVKQGKPIDRIMILNSKKIADSVNNNDLAHGMCGDSVHGYINGIKIEQTLGNNPSVEEYYICNPSLFFDHVETWMQFTATEWVKISGENTKNIKVPPNDDSILADEDALEPELLN